MGLISDIIISVPIGIIYNIIIHKIGDMVNENKEYKIKIQRNLIITFIGGVIAIILGYILFDKNKYLKNRAIRFGLYVGSLFLLTHTLFYNWNNLTNDTKLIIMTINLIILFWIAYFFSYTESFIGKIKNENKNKNIDIDTDTDTDSESDTD
jgi:hypothetical protein